MRGTPPAARAVRFCAVRPGPGDPLESLSGALRESGVRVTRVNHRAARITGRIDPADGAPGFRVDVSLFPRPDACFVEIACEASGGPADAPGPDEWAARLKMELLDILTPAAVAERPLPSKRELTGRERMAREG